jgi:hypothetical protein
MKNWQLNLIVFGTLSVVVAVIVKKQYELIRKDLKQNWDV